MSGQTDLPAPTQAAILLSPWQDMQITGLRLGHFGSFCRTPARCVGRFELASPVITLRFRICPEHGSVQKYRADFVWKVVFVVLTAK